jgi:transposase
MDEREQRVVIKFLWLEEYGTKVIHAHLPGTLGATAVSLRTVKRWVRHFREGYTSCKDKPRLGRPLTILGDI